MISNKQSSIKKTIYPNNFEKQKVSLVFNVFNEKTVAVLDKEEGMEGNLSPESWNNGRYQTSHPYVEYFKY